MEQELDLGLRAIGGICGGLNSAFLQWGLLGCKKKEMINGLEAVAKVKTDKGRVNLDDWLGCGCCMGRIGLGMAGIGLGAAYPWVSISVSAGFSALWAIHKLQTRMGTLKE